MEILWANCNNLFELKPQIILKALYSLFCFLLASQSIWVNSLLRATLRYPYECLTIFRRGKKAESTLLSHIFGFPFESKVFVACIFCSMLIFMVLTPSILVFCDASISFRNEVSFDK